MKLMFINVMLLSQVAYTSISHTIGNGGDVVVCQNQSGQLDVQALDLFEAEQDGFSFLFDANKFENEFALVQHIIDEHRKPLSFRANQWQKHLKEFKEQTVYQKQTDLSDVPDSHHISVPENCEIRQLVIYRNPPTPWHNAYVVDVELWNRMDSVSKATMILHEIIFKHRRQAFGDVNSIKTRGMTAAVISKKFLGLNEAEIIEAFEYIDSENFLVSKHGLPLSRNTLTSIQDHTIFTGELARNWEVKTPQGLLPTGQCTPKQNTIYSSPGLRYAIFNESSIMIYPCMEDKFDSSSFNRSYTWFILDKNGRKSPLSAFKSEVIPGAFVFELHNNLSVKRASNIFGGELLTTNGQFQYFPGGTLLTFDTNGRVSSSEPIENESEKN